MTDAKLTPEAVQTLWKVRAVIDTFNRETSRTGIDAIHAVHDIALALGVEMYPVFVPSDDTDDP